MHSRNVSGAPQALEANNPASAYFGSMRLVSGDEQVLWANRESCIKMALDIERAVHSRYREQLAIFGAAFRQPALFAGANQAFGLGPSGNDQERGKMSGADDARCRMGFGQGAVF